MCSLVRTVSDVTFTRVDELLHVYETYVSGDCYYTGAAKIAEHNERDVIWSIVARRYFTSITCKVVHCYGVKRKIECATARLCGI